jgi:hemoglobin
LKTDIKGRLDIVILVDTFYRKVLKDRVLSNIFKELSASNFTYHLPVMYDFWENIILRTGSYEGNPMHLHRNINHLTPLNEGHFKRWDKLFLRTIDELYEGPKATIAKKQGLSISLILREKLLGNQKN